MVGEIRAEHESEWAAMGRGAELLGIGTPETVRKWCRQAEVDAGRRPGVTSEDSAGLNGSSGRTPSSSLPTRSCGRHPAFFAAEVDRLAAATAR
jgi:transposase